MSNQHIGVSPEIVVVFGALIGLSGFIIGLVIGLSIGVWL